MTSTTPEDRPNEDPQDDSPDTGGQDADDPSDAPSATGGTESGNDGVEEGDNPAGPGGPAPGPGTGSDGFDGPTTEQGPTGPQGDDNVGTDTSDGPNIDDDTVPGADDDQPYAYPDSGSGDGEQGIDDPIQNAADDVTIEPGDNIDDVERAFAAETGLDPQDFNVRREDGKFVTEYTDDYYAKEYADRFDKQFGDVEVTANDVSIQESTGEDGETIVEPSLSEEVRREAVVEQVQDQFDRFYITEDDLNFTQTEGEDGSTQLDASFTEEAASMITERQLADEAGVAVTEIDAESGGTVTPQTNDAARSLAEYQVEQQPGVKDADVTEVAPGVYRATATETDGDVVPSGGPESLTSTVATPEGKDLIEQRQANAEAAEQLREIQETLFTSGSGGSQTDGSAAGNETGGGAGRPADIEDVETYGADGPDSTDSANTPRVVGEVSVARPGAASPGQSGKDFGEGVVDFLETGAESAAPVARSVLNPGSDVDTNVVTGPVASVLDDAAGPAAAQFAPFFQAANAAQPVVDDAVNAGSTIFETTAKAAGRFDVVDSVSMPRFDTAVPNEV
ncbi:hypothetical protein LQ368_15680, partial [Halobacterium noricense]|nr:hypothetical protein [Halobacterium noricense]